MTTVINQTPGDNGNGGGGAGLVIGIIIVLVIVILFFVYGLPAIRGGSKSTNIDVNIPTPSSNTGGSNGGGTSGGTTYP